MGELFEAGQRALLLDSRGRRYLVTLQSGGSFHFHRGIVSHDSVIGASEGVVVRSTGGEHVIALRPTLSEFVLKMPRGAQIIYPKDLAMVLMMADIYPGATVVEAGAGSGAMTIALLRAVGPQGRVITYEVREDFAVRALANIEAFLGEVSNLSNLELRIGDVHEHEPAPETEVDRIVLDLPEPWRAVKGMALALRTGGIFLAYLPTILQVHQLTMELRADPRWSAIATIETLVRPWHVEVTSVRPEHRMVAHTGFITVARRITAGPADHSSQGPSLERAGKEGLSTTHTPADNH